MTINIKNSLRIIAQGLFFIVVIYAFGRLGVVSFDSRLSGDIPVYLQNVSTDAVTLRWHSASAYLATVKYGTDKDNLQHALSESEQGNKHRIRLSALKPNTRYFYSIYNGDTAVETGEQYWFFTAPQASDNEPVRIWITGDQGIAGKTQTEMRDAMITWTGIHARENKPSVDLWLTTGDNAYRSGSVEQFKEHFFAPFTGILRNIPVVPAYGNHDARRWSFFRLFEFPTQAKQNADASEVALGTKKYFSMDYGNAHIVMLDTTTSSMEINSPMLNWLKKDLAITQQDWVIVVTHHPPYTHGTHNSDNIKDSGGRMHAMRENVVPVLEQFGVDMVISGHSHGYERSFFMLCNYKDSQQFNRSYIQDRGDNEDQLKLLYRKRSITRQALSGTIYMVMGSSARAEDGPYDHPVLPVSLKTAGSVVLDIVGNKLTSNFITTEYTVNDRFYIMKGDKSAPAARQSCNFKIEPPRSLYY